MKKEAVVQEHGTGCGVACAAYVLGISYQAALKLFNKPAQAATVGYYAKDIVKALSRRRACYTHRYVKGASRAHLKIPGVIVYVQRSKKYPLGHYLARAEDGSWMNPWSNYPIIAPAKARFEKRLPGKPLYVIFPAREKS